MLPFCFGLILITSCLHRKDTRLSPRYIFTFQGSLGTSLCDIILTRSLWTTCSHHSRAPVPTFTYICVPYFFHQMPRLYFFINFFFLVLVRLLLNITKVLARPFPKGTVPFGASNVPFGSATKETMCPLVSPQHQHIFNRHLNCLNLKTLNSTKMFCWQVVQQAFGSDNHYTFKMRGVVMRYSCALWPVNSGENFIIRVSHVFTVVCKGRETIISDTRIIVSLPLQTMVNTWLTLIMKFSPEFTGQRAQLYLMTTPLILNV